MGISYSAFLTQIRNYTEVDSTVLTDNIIAQFLRNVELDVANKVDYDDLRKYFQATLTANNKFSVMPADTKVVRGVFVATTVGGSLSSGTVVYAEKRDQSFIREFNNTGATGLPKYWANYDDFTIMVAPTPDVAYPIEVEIIREAPSFTSTNNTYLSTYEQNLLLYGVLTEAFSYLKGPMDLYNLNKTKYDEELQAFALIQMGRRRRGEYDDGVPRIQINSPPPNTTL